MPTPKAIEQLTNIIASGLPQGSDRTQATEQTKAAIDSVFGERYPAKSQFSKRVVITATEDQVQFAGILHHDSPNSGVYGGMSLIWFPIPAEDGEPASSLLTFVCGTRGLSPDEHILARPGHVRHLRAMQRYLKEATNEFVWVKPDPTNLSIDFPKSIRSKFSRFENVLKRYGSHIYACVEVPQEQLKAQKIVSAFLDLYAWERNWFPLKSAEEEVENFKTKLRACIFPKVSQAELIDLLKQRRFVILQGPPGTGKTRIAQQILHTHFKSSGFTVQFHAAVSYETFVAGISPRVDGDSLHFEVKPGWLVQALQECRQKPNAPYLLNADEINRADLSRILGESIYLFEPREQNTKRQVKLPQPLPGGEDTLEMPENFYLLGTMNTADRSIAIMDMAVRRRFAFVDIWPDIDVVAEQNIALAIEAFARLQDIFSQYASEEAFSLMPGHSYFLADSERELKARLRYELAPLIREYLQEGRLTSCDTELRTYLDWLENEVHSQV
jgi:5-methylcytosine-specific restriction protein B